MKPPPSLRRQLLVVIAVSVLLITVLNTGLEISSDFRMAKRETLELVEDSASIALPLLQNALIVGDLASVQEMLDRLVEHRHFRHARVLDPLTGKVIVEGRTQRPRPALDAPAWLAALLDHGFVPQRFTIAAGGTIYASFELEASFDPVVEHLWQEFIIEAGSGLLLIALQILLFGGILRAQLRPLENLSEAARQIGAGNLACRAPVEGSPELQATAEAFNRMTDNLAEAQATLEERVRQRTLELQEKEEQLRLAASVFQNSAEGVLVTDRNGTIISVNPAFTDITGYAEAEALGRNPNMLRSDRHDTEFFAELWRTLSSEGKWQGEIWNRRKSGEAYLEWLTINRIADSAGEPIRYISVFHDITDMRRSDERIRYLAFHDALTDLPNRTLFQERLEHAIERTRRDNGQLSVSFLDLDGFKDVNDSLGHDVGDLLLQEVARRIRLRLRRGIDTVARLGGDEFVVLLEDVRERSECARLAEEIIADIAQPVVLRGLKVSIGASIGIALFPDDGDDAETLTRHADTAMYEAKQAGKGGYRFYIPPATDSAS